MNAENIVMAVNTAAVALYDPEAHSLEIDDMPAERAAELLDLTSAFADVRVIDAAVSEFLAGMMEGAAIADGHGLLRGTADCKGAAALARAAELFPEHAAEFAHIGHAGRAEAALLAYQMHEAAAAA